MNDGLQFSATPKMAQQQKSESVPLEVRAMARELGLSASDLFQAEEMWSKLNELSENDPDSYKQLVKVSAKHVEKQRSNNESTKNKKVVDIEKEAEEERQKKADAQNSQDLDEEEQRVAEKIFEQHFGGNKPRLMPDAGFVIKSESTTGGKVMINCCSHAAVQPAVSATGQELVKTQGGTVSTNGLKVPMALGESRNCQVSNGVGKAVDVLLHPWVIEHATTDREFKREVSQLAVDWVVTERPELSISSTYRWKHINSSYKGGTGPDQNTPVPFYIEASRLDPQTQNQKSQAKKRKDTSLNLGLTPQGITATPESLLTRLRHKEEKENLLDDEPIALNLQPPSKQNTKKKILIEEIDPEDNNDSGVPAQVLEQDENGSFDLSLTAADPVEKKSTAMKSHTPRLVKQRAKPAVKKGFLNKAKKSLYPAEGSEQGQKEGSYSRLLGKCQVVDMAEMKQKEEAQKKASAPYELRKGFLTDNDESPLYAEDTPNNVCTPAMEELFEEADPEFSRASRPVDNTSQEEIEYTLSALRTFASELNFAPKESEKTPNKIKNVHDNDEGVEESKHNETNPLPTSTLGENKEQGFKRGFLQPAYELKEITDESAAGPRQVKLKAVIKGATAFSDLTLEVSQRLVLIHSVPLDYELKVPLDFDIDPNLTEASFSKKFSRLTITLTSSVSSSL